MASMKHECVKCEMTVDRKVELLGEKPVTMPQIPHGLFWDRTRGVVVSFPGGARDRSLLQNVQTGCETHPLFAQQTVGLVH